MSFTNKTAHYELPQYEQNDIPSILTDFNGAMEDIDEAIYASANASAQASADVQTLTTTVTSVQNTVATIQSSQTADEVNIAQLQSDVSTLQGTVNTNTGNISTLSTKVGTATLDTTASDLSGAVNELKADIDAIPTATIDTSMSDTSENAVQNKVIKSYVDSNAVAEEKQTSTLAVGATSVTLTYTEQTIGATTLVDWFVSDPNISPIAVSVTTNTVVLTFEAQSSALTVGALVKN